MQEPYGKAVATRTGPEPWRCGGIVSRPPAGPSDPRWEPGAVNLHAGICPGGAPQGASLPGTATYLVSEQMVPVPNGMKIGDRA